MPRLSRADALRAKKAAYERARRAKKRAEAARAVRLAAENTERAEQAALYHALQDPVQRGPQQLLDDAVAVLKQEATAETVAKLAATQDELTRVLNVGLTGQHLLKLVEQLEQALQILRRCGLHLPR